MFKPSDPAKFKIKDPSPSSDMPWVGFIEISQTYVVFHYMYIKTIIAVICNLLRIIYVIRTHKCDR